MNIAARIEKQTKHVQSDILISRTSYNLLKDELIVCPRGLAPVVDDMNAMEVFQPIGIIDHGSVVFNDPLYEGLNLESKASVLENAPPNLLSINYTEYAYQARPEYKKA